MIGRKTDRIRVKIVGKTETERGKERERAEKMFLPDYFFPRYFAAGNVFGYHFANDDINLGARKLGISPLCNSFPLQNAIRANVRIARAPGSGFRV